MRKRRREAAIASPESARLRIMLGAVSKLRQPHCYEKKKWKQDLDYRRFLCRGTPKVSAEWSLLAIAANILKLHYKLKNGRLGTGLVIPKGFSVGL